MVPAAYLCGENIVRDCMYDATISGFMEKTIYDEIIPTLTLPQEELLAFAGAVKDRFCNPFIDHALLSITLNSTAKWKARVLPSVKGYLKNRHTACVSDFFVRCVSVALPQRNAVRRQADLSPRCRRICIAGRCGSACVLTHIMAQTHKPLRMTR